MDRFIARENIKHFFDRLQTEEDGAVRATLHRLLLAELDKFAKLAERLDMVDHNISRVTDLALLPRARVNGMGANQDSDAALARQHLFNLEGLYEVFVEYRRHLVKEIDRQAD